MNTIKRLILSSIILVGMIISAHPSKTLAAPNVSVWWPAANVTLTGVQPFKAVVDGMSVGSYNMFWQVDNGQLNSMPTNTTSYPHKEVSVDVGGWKWSSSGTYTLNFVAKDLQGNTIGSKSIPVKINASASTGSTNVSKPSNPVTVPTPGTQLPIETPKSISIWWPTDKSKLSGVQPLKVVVDRSTLSNYSMYWQVDNGQMNLMNDNYNEGPHKESSVNFTEWNWKGSGPYTLTFTAKNSSGSTIASKSIQIFTVQTGSTPAPIKPVPPTTVSAPINPTPVISGNPLSGSQFYTDPNSNAANQVKAWATSNPYGASQISKIASQPVAKWLGNWNSNIFEDTKKYVDTATNAGKVPVMIAYNIPVRDCNGYSGGGSSSVSSYKSWITSIASAIGSRRAVVVLEPDALTLTDCLSTTDRAARFTALNEAVNTLKANPNTIVYMDAGNSNWISAEEMSSRLLSAGIAKADGFSLNVSNFYTTTDSINYGQQVSSKIGNKHFIVDTSRNGRGSNGEWCNPSGRALGNKPTTSTGNSLVDAFLWLKAPGESDGTCNGGPSAGTWWSEYAIGLAERAAY